MKKVIGVFSGKGGVGKTVCALNIGLAIHEFGDKIVLMDCDLKHPNMALHLGLHDFHTTVQDVLERRISPLEAISIHNSGLRFIPGSIALRNFEYDNKYFKESLDDINNLVLFDGPSGSEGNALALLEICDEIIIVTSPDIPAVTDAMKIIQIANDMDKRSISMIINRVQKKHELDIKHIEDACKVPILGIVPDDKNVKRGLHQRLPVTLYKPFSNSSIEFRRIGAAVVGRNYSPPRFYRIRRLFH
ncbi:MAG: P-loop NTPase [Candidatus Aenigmatarchaeota archaeon]|nr:P-loop NTPase [Nanoarchaeota archaeon]